MKSLSKVLVSCHKIKVGSNQKYKLNSLSPLRCTASNILGLIKSSVLTALLRNSNTVMQDNILGGLIQITNNDIAVDKINECQTAKDTG